MTISRIVRAAAPILVLSLVLSLYAEGPARAQSIPSSYRDIEHGQEASVFWGFLSLTPGSLDLGPKAGSFLGARYLVEASGPLFLEGQITYLPTTRVVVDPRRAEGDRSIGETDVSLLMVDARIAFSLPGRRAWKRLSPHLFIGGGLAYDAMGQSELEGVLLPEDVFDFGTTFTANAGTGLRFALSSRLMLRTDASLTLWQLNTPSGFDDPVKELDSVEQSEWVSGYGFTVSAAWRF